MLAGSDVLCHGDVKDLTRTDVESYLKPSHNSLTHYEQSAAAGAAVSSVQTANDK